MDKLYVKLIMCVIMNIDILFRYLESNFCENGKI